MGGKPNVRLSKKALRQTLKYWDRLQQLGESPLSRLNIVEQRRRAAGRRDTVTGRGLSLREVLREAIEALKPVGQNEDYVDRRWRPYLLLKEEFANGRSPEYLCQKLNIALRTYQHSRGQALEKLVSMLAEWEDETKRASAQPDVNVPFLAPPKPAHRLVGRYRLLQQVKDPLFRGAGTALVAIHGLPGIGKTALALELAYDPEVRTFFRDGILWAGLGREPDRRAILGAWARALDVPERDIGQRQNARELAARIHEAIGLRRLLLVIDDGWALEDALAFQLGGPNCACLLTTRRRDIALDFAEENALAVEELTRAGSLLLFGQLAPGVCEAEPEEAQRLVQTVGGLPLAIILMAKYVRRRTRRGERPLETALHQLHETQERLQLEMPQTPATYHADLQEGQRLSLPVIIGISEGALDDISRRALYMLSLFPPKPNTFSREAAMAVSGAPEAVLTTLENHSLIDASGPQRYTLHQTIADYAATRLDDSVSKKRFVSYFVQFVAEQTGDYAALDHEINNITTTLQLALVHDMKSQFLHGVTTLYPYLETRGLYDQVEMWLGEARLMAESVQDVTALATTLQQSGRIAERKGNYPHAEALYSEGLRHLSGQDISEKTVDLLANLGSSLLFQGKYDQAVQRLTAGLRQARELNYREGVRNILLNLGVIAHSRGDYEQAERYYQESLVLARQLGDRERISTILGNLGELATRYGDYTLAEGRLQEGLLMARELGHRERISLILANLGKLAASREDDVQARKYYEESLMLARAIGHQERISAMLANLGAVAARAGNFHQAEERYREAVDRARKIGHRWLLCTVLCHWGELNVKIDHIDVAVNLYEEALELSKELDSRELTGRAIFGMAKVAAAKGNLTEARRQGKASLATFEALTDHQAEEVESWLRSLDSNITSC